jgi:hypothetical protein
MHLKISADNEDIGNSRSAAELEKMTGVAR